MSLPLVRTLILQSSQIKSYSSDVKVLNLSLVLLQHSKVLYDLLKKNRNSIKDLIPPNMLKYCNLLDSLIEDARLTFDYIYLCAECINSTDWLVQYFNFLELLVLEFRYSKLYARALLHTASMLGALYGSEEEELIKHYAAVHMESLNLFYMETTKKHCGIAEVILRALYDSYSKIDHSLDNMLFTGLEVETDCSDLLLSSYEINGNGVMLSDWLDVANIIQEKIEDFRSSISSLKFDLVVPRKPYDALCNERTLVLKLSEMSINKSKLNGVIEKLEERIPHFLQDFEFETQMYTVHNLDCTEVLERYIKNVNECTALVMTVKDVFDIVEKAKRGSAVGVRVAKLVSENFLGTSVSKSITSTAVRQKAKADRWYHYASKHYLDLERSYIRFISDYERRVCAWLPYGDLYSALSGWTEGVKECSKLLEMGEKCKKDLEKAEESFKLVLSSCRYLIEKLHEKHEEPAETSDPNAVPNEARVSDDIEQVGTGEELFHNSLDVPDAFSDKSSVVSFESELIESDSDSSADEELENERPEEKSEEENLKKIMSIRKRCVTSLLTSASKMCEELENYKRFFRAEFDKLKKVISSTVRKPDSGSKVPADSGPLPAGGDEETDGERSSKINRPSDIASPKQRKVPVISPPSKQKLEITPKKKSPRRQYGKKKSPLRSVNKKLSPRSQLKKSPISPRTRKSPHLLPPERDTSPSAGSGEDTPSSPHDSHGDHTVRKKSESSPRKTSGQKTPRKTSEATPPRKGSGSTPSRKGSETTPRKSSDTTPSRKASGTTPRKSSDTTPSRKASGTTPRKSSDTTPSRKDSGTTPRKGSDSNPSRKGSNSTSSRKGSETTPSKKSSDALMEDSTVEAKRLNLNLAFTRVFLFSEVTDLEKYRNGYGVAYADDRSFRPSMAYFETLLQMEKINDKADNERRYDLSSMEEVEKLYLYFKFIICEKFRAKQVPSEARLFHLFFSLMWLGKIADDSDIRKALARDPNVQNILS